MALIPIRRAGSTVAQSPRYPVARLRPREADGDGLPGQSTNSSGLPFAASSAHSSRMGTKSRESIYGASIRASAERAKEARKEADRLACQAWNQRMLGYKGPAQPSPTLGDALNVNRRWNGTPYRHPKGTPLIGVFCW
jgi:hypothetical protein